MEKNFQSEEGISLLDVAKLLLGKIKLLILVVLIGGIVGASFAVVTTRKVDYYGTKVEFYVNPKKAGGSDAESQYGVYGAYGKHVMDNMVKLLNSEIFTELLILNGEPLPVAKDWINASNEDEVALGLGTLVDSAKAAQADADQKQSKANEDLTILKNTWIKAVANIEDYKTTSYSKTLYNKLTNTPAYCAQIEKDAPEIFALYEAYEGENGTKAVASTAQETASEETETALTAWRKTDKYKKTANVYGKFISFSYLTPTESSSDSSLARSFIYANISVLDGKYVSILTENELNGEQFAAELFDIINNVVPEYIKENMAIPAGYESTNCKKISTLNEIVCTNPNYTRNQAIKYGILLAGVAFVLACAVIIVVDRADKRLRDYNVITKEFGVPVLGVIPSIHYLEERSEKTNTEDKK